MRVLPAVLVAFLLWTAVTAPAGAHAVLQSSSPAHGSSVDAAPREVVLIFTEPVHPQTSSAEVLDASGRTVSVGFEVASDSRTLRVKLQALPRGTYTVRWKVLSRLDGHLTAGAVSFGVGEAPAPLPSVEPGPPLWQVVLRWVGYLAAVSLAGSVAFIYPFVPASLRPDVRAGLWPITLSAAAALVAATVLESLVRAVWLQPPGQSPWQTVWALLRGSPEGASLLLRLGAATLAVAAARGPSPWVAALAGGAAVAGLTATSHAWAAGPVAVLADWLHLAAASVWVGGLPCLAVTLARLKTREAGSPVVTAFSRWAAASLALVAITGLYGAYLHVPDLRALLDTGYGRWLLAKVALVLALVALGAVNRYRILPRLASARGALRRLQLSVRAEVVVAAAVLLSAAGLALSPPARVVRAASTTQELLLAAAPGSLRLVLGIRPAEPGWNRFTLTVRDGRGDPVPVDRPMLRLRNLVEDAATPPVVLRAEGRAQYAAEGAYLPTPGFWEVEVVLRRRGKPDEVVWFPLRLGSFQLRSDLQAFRLLLRVQETFQRLRTWRETEQTTDGAGNVVVTHYTYQRPDRVAFEVVGGLRGVLVGKERFVRTERGWQRDELPEPFAARGPVLYMQNPLRAALGRQEPCPHDPTELCRAVLWDSPDGLASFAAWVETRTHRVYRLLMWAPAHAMTSVLRDFDAPLTVQRPVP